MPMTANVVTVVLLFPCVSSLKTDISNKPFPLFKDIKSTRIADKANAIPNIL